jgi:hypothetical protein
MGDEAIFGAVAIGLVAGGGVYLWWRSRRVAAKSACEKLCDLVPDVNGARQDCLLACGVLGVLGQVATAVSPFHDSSEQWGHEGKRRRFNNNRLNGGTPDPSQTFDQGAPYDAPGASIRILDPSASSGTGLPNWLNGGVARYPNGCVPFFGAPGWSKCAPGTLDEYGQAIDAATPDDDWGYSEKNFVKLPYYLTPSAREAALANVADDGTLRGSLPVDARPALKADAMLGTNGDPFSGGPWPDHDTGLPYWYVRSQRTVPAPVGTAPRAVVLSIVANASGETLAQTRAKIAALTDAQALENISISQQGTGVSSTFDCATAKAGGFTWDAALHAWRRMRAGEHYVAAPSCASSPPVRPTSAPSVFGFGILGY